MFPTLGVPLPRPCAATKLPPSIFQYVSLLKDLYSSDTDWPLFPPGDWPPKSTQTEFYVNLELIHHKILHSQDEQHNQVGKSLSLGDVKQVLNERECYHLKHLLLADFFQTSSKSMLLDKKGDSLNKKGIKVVVDGAPGVGKTSMARKACKDWANGKLWPEYNMVVYLPLKDNAISSATELWQLFLTESHDQELAHHIACEVSKVRGEGVLFILDGWDELSDQKDASVIRKVVYKKLLQRCSLLITSRPHASTELVRYQVPDRHFEIIGLTEHQIKKIVANHFGDEFKSEAFLRTMEVSGVMKLCYIPLNLTIVLHVYNQKKKLPHTLTELYDTFMMIMFTRQLDLYHLDSITSLPPDAAELYKTFSKMAFDGLISNSLIFSEEDLERVCSFHPRPTYAFTLGLLTAFKCCVSTGIITKYQFTHLTIQEYLAAEHLACRPAEEQKKFIVEHINDEKFLVMMQFLFGKASLKGTTGRFKELFAVLCSPEDPRRLQILLALAVEAKKEEYLDIISTRMSKMVLSIQTEDWNDHEMSLLARFVDHSQWNSTKLSTFSVVKRMNAIKMQRQTFCLGQLIRQKCTTTIEIVAKFHQFRFMISPLSNEGFILSDFELYTVRNSGIGKFKLYRHGSTIHGMNNLDTLMAILGSSDAIQGLSEVLSQGLCPRSISIINCQSIDDLLATRQTLVTPDMNSVFKCIAAGLQELHLTGWLVFSHTAALLFGAASASSDLRVLDLSNNLLFSGKLRNVALNAFVHMLSHTNTLECLFLKECHLDEEVLSLFAMHNSTVKVLNIDCTHEMPKTINLQLLANNLSVLYLSHCYLDDEDAANIGSMLHSNATLKKLFLDRNNITAGGAIAIFVGLMENNSLNCLSLSRQTVKKSSDGAVVEEMQKALAETLTVMFQTNSTLSELCLATFTPYPGRQFGELDHELKIQDKNTKEHIKRVHVINCMHYNLEFLNTNAETIIPVVFLPPEDLLPLVQQSSIHDLDLSGHNLTEPSTMHSLVTFLKNNRMVNHLKLNVCRLHELYFAPMQEELFNGLCNNGTLTDLSTDPESASVLSSLVDRVNLERHTKGIPFLTIHTITDSYDLTVRTWSHSP